MRENIDTKIELLAPAGDYECCMAAVKAGADAVYAGGNRFGARAYAANFSEEELLKAIDFVHLSGKRLYLTVNTVLKNSEIEELYDYLCPFYEAGLDGVIVQDPGVIKVVGNCFPELPIHASTQMSITDVEGVMLLKKWGITRVVPARELSLNEIRNIKNSTGIELECFIHGALCYSYSGKCLFSSIAGGRSGNRGRCAQPCRLPYEGKYVLSARDICTVRLIPDLIKAGISSFKIEGRMKSKEYVAGVTGIYRKYIDLYNGSPDMPYSVGKDDLDDLERIYTRSGNCNGYYHVKNGREMITLDKPSYNMADSDKLKELYIRYTEHDDKLKVKCSLYARKGEPFKLVLSSDETEAEYNGPKVETARNQPTDEENIRKHIGKTGDTFIEFDTIDISSDKDIFIPVSVLNTARREAVKALTDKLLAHYRRKTDIPAKSKENTPACSEKSPSVNLRIDRLNMLDTLLTYELGDTVTIDMNSFCIERVNKNNKESGLKLIKKTSESIRNTGRKFFLSLPYIIRNRWFERNKLIESIIEEDITDGIVTDNYEGLYYLKSKGYKGCILTDIHLYAANDHAINMLTSAGADIITCPVELNLKELNTLKPFNSEFIIYGRLPMMISAQCTEKTLKSCVMDNGMSDIRDRYGNVFTCVRNCNECYNTILNCVPLLIDPVNDIPKSLKPSSFRIHFTTETDEDVRQIMDYYDKILKGGHALRPEIKRTLGHLKRGVE